MSTSQQLHGSFRNPAAMTNLDMIDTSLIDIDHELANVPRAFTDTDAKKVFYRTSVFLSVPLLTLLLFAGLLLCALSLIMIILIFRQNGCPQYV